MHLNEQLSKLSVTIATIFITANNAARLVLYSELLTTITKKVLENTKIRNTQSVKANIDNERLDVLENH